MLLHGEHRPTAERTLDLAALDFTCRAVSRDPLRCENWTFNTKAFFSIDVSFAFDTTYAKRAALPRAISPSL
ncbi:MAG: hypothetical protein ABSE59_09510 [Opitutaceae bacterium]